MDACDVDPLFTSMYNTDWNHNTLGIDRQSFITAYYEMIKICVDKRNLSKTVSHNNIFVVVIVVIVVIVIIRLIVVRNRF